jgi:8-oxo-dGTP pyrophosphatase MutT (NUDIX family)
MIAKIAHLVEVRYPGEADILHIEPGQEPKGAGNPPAGPSVPDDEAADRREALEEIRAEEGEGTPLGDLVQHPDTLTSAENPDRPKAAGGGVTDEELDDETPLADLLDPDVDTRDDTQDETS